MMLAGKYILGDKIGEGAMGVVYRARHAQLDIELAIKVLHDQYANDETFRARFLREARVAHAFVHKHAVMLRDFGVTDENRPYLTMDLCPGKPLSTLLQEVEWLPPRRAVRIALQVADVLADAHAAGILHRDIKPDNIMVDDSSGDDEVKVMDFGIAKMMVGDPADADLTRGNAIGTPLYMSPEQAAGEPVDGRSDLYSLGVVLYQCLAGFPPFQAGSVQAILMKHLTQPPPPLPERVDAREWLEPMVMKALAKHPESRYAGAADMVRACRAFLDADWTALTAMLEIPTSQTLSSRARRVPRRKHLSFTPDDIPVSPQAERRDSATSDPVPRPLAALRPVDETAGTGDTSGAIPPVVKQVSPARENADQAPESNGGMSWRPRQSQVAAGEHDRPVPPDIDEAARARTILSSHAMPGAAGAFLSTPEHEPGALSRQRSAASDHERAPAVLSGSAPGIDAHAPSRMASARPRPEDEHPPPAGVSGPEVQASHDARRPVWRRLTGVVLILILLFGTTLALARWAGPALLPDVLQDYLQANPRLATTLDTMISLGFLFQDQGTGDEETPNGPAQEPAGPEAPREPAHPSTPAPPADTPSPPPAQTATARARGPSPAPSTKTARASGREDPTATRPSPRGTDRAPAPIVVDLDAAGREVFVNRGDIVLAGTFAPDVVRVEVQGRRIRAGAGRFKTDLHLKEGRTTVTVIGYAGTRSETRLVDIVVDSRPPRLFLDQPDNGIYLARRRVPVAGTVRDEYPVRVTVDGKPLRVRGDHFLGMAVLRPGKNALEIVATDQAGNRTVRHVTVYHSLRRSPRP